jgi:hypothetical protein
MHRKFRAWFYKGQAIRVEAGWSREMLFEKFEQLLTVNNTRFR